MSKVLIDNALGNLHHFECRLGTATLLAPPPQLGLPPEAMYFDKWPVRHPSLLSGGRAVDEPTYVALWERLDTDPSVESMFVRVHPEMDPSVRGDDERGCRRDDEPGSRLGA